MVLAYHGRDTDYDEIRAALRIKPFGAPAANVRLLTAFDVRVVYSTTSLVGLRQMLDDGHPVIAFVKTGNLPHWTYDTDHALVVIGYEGATLFVNDPDRPDGPITVGADDFELAWLERDYYFAALSAGQDQDGSGLCL